MSLIRKPKKNFNLNLNKKDFKKKLKDNNKENIKKS